MGIEFTANTIPEPEGSRVKDAVREALAGEDGKWEVRLSSDRRLDYTVTIRKDDGPDWEWVFSDPWEQEPATIARRIRNGIRGAIPKALSEHREEILRIAAKYRASNVRMFGSVLHGEAKPDSDLDLLVTAGPKCSLFDLIGIKLDVEALLGCKVDVVTEGGISKYIRDEVLKEAVAL